VHLADLHASPPAIVPDGSIESWVWLAVVLAIVVASGLVIASRR
jgi:hypothetical protein